MNRFFIIWITFCLISAITSCNLNTETNKSNEEVKNDSTFVEKRIGIKLNDRAGVKELQCAVNGLSMSFIFDTGASNVCISLTEAVFMLKNGYLEDIDIIGTSTAQVADGRIVENTVVNLHSIEIGGIIITDVKATVVNSLDAPLLLGQSVIDRLGKIEIDGDSLFIIKKVIKGNDKQANYVSEDDKMKKPSDYDWLDKIKMFFGNHDKSEQFVQYAWQLMNDDMYELSIEECKHVQDNDKNFWPAYYVSGCSYLKFEKYSLAYDDFTMASKRISEEDICVLGNVDTIGCGEVYANFAYALGKYVLQDTHDYDLLHSAIKYSQISMQYRMHSLYFKVVPYKVITQSLIELESYSEAEKWAKKLIEIDKAQGYYFMGNVRLFAERNAEAIRFYEKSLEFDGENDYALNNLSICYWVLGYKRYSTELRIKAAKMGNKNSANWLRNNNIEY